MIRTRVADFKSPLGLSAFPWPNDSQAWWSFLACQFGAWTLLFGWDLDRRGLSLAVAAFGLFFAGDWLSALAGRSREGAVRPAAFSFVGLGLLLTSTAALLVFLSLLPSNERKAWSMVITGVGCLVALMFILRLEMRPLDGRLLYLTHLILTLPALVLGFLRYGVGAVAAWSFWILPAVYYPAQALLAHYWMKGTDAPGESLSILAAPLLMGIFAEAWIGGWIGAAFLAFFLGRAILLLQRRRLSNGTLPGFATMRRLHREFTAWNVVGILTWAICVHWG
jgi:uncharacterized membrane protein